MTNIAWISVGLRVHTLYVLCCADVVDDWLAPQSSAILRVGLDTKLIDCVGPQIVNDRVTSWAGLVVPLPVPLSITHRVVSETKTKQNMKINNKSYVF